MLSSLSLSGNHFEPEHTDSGEPPEYDGPLRLFHAGDSESHQFRALGFDLDEVRARPAFTKPFRVGKSK
jgi:hypothetical protein